MARTPHVSEAKKVTVKNLVSLIKEYPVIAALNMENMPAAQLQKMKAQLRGKVVMAMTKRRLIKIAIEGAKGSKKGIEELIPHLLGMPALMFTKESPFRLSKTLQKSRSPAPAKPGQIAPKDIMVNKGPTPFAPGPIISELSMVGLKAGVEGGKVAIKEDHIVVRKGEKISQKVAEVITRLGIEPMEIGLTITAAYEGGIIYDQSILEVDEKGMIDKLSLAGQEAMNLAVYSAYPAKETIEVLLSKAFNDAKAIGLAQSIIDDKIIEMLIGKAEASLLSLKDTAGIEVPEKIKEASEIKKENAVEELKGIMDEEKKLEAHNHKNEAPFETEVEEGIKEVEEKSLENERLDKEKQI